MATRSAPRGGHWHRTWQTIHHRAHVAESLCTVSAGDLCVNVGGWVFVWVLVYNML